MSKRRALYMLFHYPSITEAYIEAEIRAVSEWYDVLVIATDEDPKGVTYYNNHSPYKMVHEREGMLREIRAFQPHVIHAHRLFMLPTMMPICIELGIPFTVRSHAHDAFPSRDPRVADWLRQSSSVLTKATRSDLCLGILAFPFTRKYLKDWGVPEEKIFDCSAVIDFHRFYDESANGSAIVNSGSYMPKKGMEDFLELGRRMPHLEFKLYSLSSRMHHIDELKEKNRRLGSHVSIMDPVQPEMMPGEFKKAQWMVYTADPILANVCWPVSIAEAQASGVGVCMRNIRPDLRDYVGESGFLYNSLDEVEAIISHPFDQGLRSKGFEQARKSDVFAHREILLGLWDST